MQPISMTADDNTWFWSQVRIVEGDGCWEWIGWRNHYGYGRIIGHGAHGYMAHRIAWTLANGKPRDCVLHKCDNPPCVRPDHLFEGTRADNNADKMIKGRYVYRRRNRERRGEEMHNAKLTEPIVAECRIRNANGETVASLAREYGVNGSAMDSAVKGRTWKCVPLLRRSHPVLSMRCSR